MEGSSSTCNATERALKAVEDDRADQSETNLECTLFKFLQYILQDLFSTPGFNTTEEVNEDTCIDIVEKALDKNVIYSKHQLLEHKRLWDIVTRDKTGNDKEHCFPDWCRKVASYCPSDNISNRSSGSRRSCSGSLATEHAAAEEEATQKAACYRALAEDMLASQLTPKQESEPKYKLQKDKAITQKQRSWVSHMLRKNLGDAKVGYYILNHGVPEVLNIPLRFNKVINRALLQSMLDEFMTWHCSLLQYIVQCKAHPDMAVAKKLSDPKEDVWREQRQRELRQARHRLKDGACLSKQKNTGKLVWYKLSSTEKQLIEDYETKKSKRQYDTLLVKKPRINGGT